MIIYIKKVSTPWEDQHINLWSFSSRPAENNYISWIKYSKRQSVNMLLKKANYTVHVCKAFSVLTLHFLLYINKYFIKKAH